MWIGYKITQSAQPWGEIIIGHQGESKELTAIFYEEK